MLAANTLDPTGSLDRFRQQVRVLAREQDIGIKPLLAFLRNDTDVEVSARMFRMRRTATVIVKQQFPVIQLFHLLRKKPLFFFTAAFAVEMIRLKLLRVFGYGVIAGIAEECDGVHTERAQLLERRLDIRLHDFLQQDLAGILFSNGYIDHISVREVCIRDVHALENHQFARTDTDARRFNIHFNSALRNIYRVGEILAADRTGISGADGARRAAAGAGFGIGSQLQQRIRRQLIRLYTDYLRELIVPLPFVDRDCAHGIERAHTAATAKQHIAAIRTVDGTVPHERHGNKQRARRRQEQRDHCSVNCLRNSRYLEHTLEHGNQNRNAEPCRCEIVDPFRRGKLCRRVDLSADCIFQCLLCVLRHDRNQNRHEPVYKQKNSSIYRLSDCQCADHAHDDEHCRPKHLPHKDTRERCSEIVIATDEHGQNQKHIAQRHAVQKRTDHAQDERRKEPRDQHKAQPRFRKQAQRFPIIVRPIRSKAARGQARQKFLKIHGYPPCPDGAVCELRLSRRSRARR